MNSRVRRSYHRGVLRSFVLLAAMCAAGCDAGGLLEVQAYDPGADAGAKAVLGPSANELVSAGTKVSNGKYQLVYTLGQPTPNQQPIKGAAGELHGGLVGATQGN